MLATAINGSQRDDRAGNSTLVAAVWKSVAITEMTRLRAQVAAAYPNTLSAGTLKQVDEQNLTALLALKEALDASAMTADQCSAWGLVAVPRMLGRRRISDALVKFRDGGAWSASPHTIPNCSLHSASGLFSQALQLHGPNLGVGGMPGAEGDGLIAAVTLLTGERLPGIWIVFTGWELESLKDESVRCQVAVLGLRTGVISSHLPRFCFAPNQTADAAPTFSLESLGESIRQQRCARWRIGGALCAISYGQAEREAA